MSEGGISDGLWKVGVIALTFHDINHKYVYVYVFVFVYVYVYVYMYAYVNM